MHSSRKFRRRNILQIQAAVSLAAFSACAWGQSVHTWNGGADPDNSWSNTANWVGGSAPDGNDEVHFAGTANLNPSYDLAQNGYRIFFDSGAGAFTLSGNAYTLFDFGVGNAPKIENNSTSTQTINMPISLDGHGDVTERFAEINPVQGDLVFGSTVTLADPGNTQLRIFGNNGKTVTFNGAISGSNSVIVREASNVIYTTANTYSGDTFINAGTLQLASGASVASAFIRIGDTSGSVPATLALTSSTGGQTIATPINVRAATGLKTIRSANSSGTNIVSGNVFLDGDATASADLAGGVLTFSGTTLDLKNQTLTVTGAGSVNISGTLQNSSGNGKVIKNGAGVLTLSNANSYAGSTTINGGVVSISTDGNLGTAPGGATPGHLALNGGSLSATSSFTLNANRGISVGASHGTVSVAASTDTLSYSGVIAGAGSFNKAGPGALTLAGNNTLTGKMILNAGTVNASTDTNFGAVPVSVSATAAGASLQFAGGSLKAASSFTLATNRTLGFLTGSGTIDVPTGVTLNVGGRLEGTTGYNKTGSGTLQLTHASSGVTGPVSVTGGVLELTTSGRIGGTGAGAGNVTLDGATLRNNETTNGNSFLTANRNLIIGAGGATFDTSASTTVALIYSGTILGVGNTVTKIGIGELRPAGPNTANFTFSKLVVLNGTYRIGNNPTGSTETGFGAVPSVVTSDAITLNGGTIGASLGLTLDSKRGITIGANGGTVTATAGALTIPSKFTDGVGAGSLNLFGTASSQLLTVSNAANELSQGVTIRGARLNVTATGASGTGSLRIEMGANAGGLSNNTAGPVELNNPQLQLISGVPDIGASTGNTLQINSKITGAGHWQKASGTGNGTLILTSSASDNTGTVNVANGQLVITANNALGSDVGGTTIASGASLVLRNNVTYTTAEPLFIGGNGSTASNGAINSVSGVNSFAGPITMNTAARINVAADEISLGGVITDGISTLGLEKTGSGKLRFNVANSYDGATTVSGGILFASNSSGSATGTGNVVVANGATLGGNGFITGAVNINANGTLAPGESIGDLDTGALTFADGTSKYLIEIDADAELADRTNVTGGVALNGATLQLSFVLSTPGVHTTPQTYVIVNNDSNDAVGGTFAASISAPPWASVLVDYAFTGTDDAGFTADGNDIAITITYTPEPTTLGLVLLSNLFLARRRRA